MVGAAGFEPATPSPPDWCANRAALRSAGPRTDALRRAKMPCKCRRTRRRPCAAITKPLSRSSDPVSSCLQGGNCRKRSKRICRRGDRREAPYRRALASGAAQFRRACLREAAGRRDGFGMLPGVGSASNMQRHRQTSDGASGRLRATLCGLGKRELRWLDLRMSPAPDLRELIGR